MDATPFAQVAVAAVATYCTGELTVLLFTGEVTETPVTGGGGGGGGGPVLPTVIPTVVYDAPPQ
jgi:hypothetical protein